VVPSKPVLCAIVVAYSVGIAYWFSTDVPPPDRAPAWVGFGVAAIVCFPLGFLVRAADRRYAHTPFGALLETRVVQVGAIVVGVAFSQLAGSMLGGDTVMSILGACGGFVLCMTLTRPF
jgi:hypothetical protein